jgi:arylsulfatase A-like enzyme
VLATRAALLTGRNHHRVGFGSVSEFPGPFPGYSSVKPRSCAALPRILRDGGYVTGGFGKWHLTPDNVQGAAGPFDNWPVGWGFDHFWGFLSGAGGQYDPIITQDNSVLGVPQGVPSAGVANLTTFPTTSPTRPSSGCTACGRRTPRSRG